MWYYDYYVDIVWYYDYCVDGISMVWQCGIFVFVFVILILNDNFENKAKDEVASRSPLVVDNYFCVNDYGQFFPRSLLTSNFFQARADHCKKWAGDTQSASSQLLINHIWPIISCTICICICMWISIGICMCIFTFYLYICMGILCFKSHLFLATRVAEVGVLAETTKYPSALARSARLQIFATKNTVFYNCKVLQHKLRFFC